MRCLLGWFGTKFYPIGSGDRALVPFGGVLNQINGVRVTLMDHGRDGHGKPIDFVVSRTRIGRVMHGSAGIVWRQAVGADAREVVSSVTGPLALGKEEALVNRAVDFDLDGAVTRGISELPMLLDALERGDVLVAFGAVRWIHGPNGVRGES